MSADVAETTPEEDLLEGIPDELRFDITERSDDEHTRIPFALDGTRYWAHKPKDYTMLALASAMSSMVDPGDIAYCVMLFCHDAFDGPTRSRVSRMEDTDLYALIHSLCDKWGEDTSKWKKAGGNREERRASTKTRARGHK